ncbi:MAG: ribosomal L7Ae/L30e/S12e/Gadd45 family protein [Clostridia bacterium]|nr:ribosomal L7Ae/L30e/S12e/Gadd45 family protein [Clostridia bacterium]
MEELKLSANKAVGTKAVLRALKAGDAVRVYVASDIDTFLYQKVTRACEEVRVPVKRVESSKELGRVCSLTIGCAAAALLK